MVIKGEKEKGGKAVPKPKEKEKCVCEICTCGRHRCPHNNFRGTDPNSSSSEHHHSSECATSESREQYKAHTQVERQKMKRPQTALRVEGGEKMELSSSYREEFQEKEMEELKRFKHQDHVHWQEETAGLEDAAVGLSSRSVLRERTGTGGPGGNWGIHMHEDYSTDSRDNGLRSLDSDSALRTSVSTQNISESQTQQQMSSSMTTSTSSSMLARSQQNVSDSTTVHDIHSIDTGAGGGDGKFMSQLHSSSLKTKKQLRGGKLVDVPDTSKTYSEAVSSSFSAQSKYSSETQQIDEDRQHYEHSDSRKEQVSSFESTGADGKTTKISSSARDVTSSTDGAPIDHSIGRNLSSDYLTASNLTHSQDLNTSTSSISQAAYSTQQLISEQDTQRQEQTRSVSENMASFEKIGSDGKPIRTSTSSREVTSSSDGTPMGTTSRPTDPAGPRKVLRGGKLETVPAEPGYYEQVLKSSVSKDTSKDATNLQTITSDVPYDVSNLYSQGLNTSTSSVVQSTYSTNQQIAEQDNQRYEQTSSVSENTATLEKTGSDGKPIRTSSTSRQVASSSDGTPFSTTPREPSGPNKIIRGGKLENIPAEPGYYDQISRTQDFNTSTTALSQSEYSTSQLVSEQDNRRFEQTSKVTDHTATLEKTGPDGKPIRTGTSTREIMYSRDGTPIDDFPRKTTGPREPAGPRKIIRGGKLEHIPAEPGYYDQTRRTQDLNTSSTAVAQSEFSTSQITTEQDIQRFEQTSALSEHTSVLEKTGPDGKPIRTGTTSREAVFTRDGTPIDATPREPAGPRKIIRGGKLEHIPAEPGYYDQVRRTQDFLTSTSEVTQSEYSTNQLITEEDNKRFEQTSKLTEKTATYEKTGPDGKPIRTSTSTQEAVSTSDGAPITDTPSRKEPAGPRKILRGGKLEYIPAEPGYYDQTHKPKDKPRDSTDSRTFSTDRTTEQQQISESERIIEESSTSLKYLGDQLTDSSRVPGPRRPSRDGRKPSDQPTTVISKSRHTDDFSSDNIHETSSTTIDERTSTSRFVDNVTDISEHTTTVVRPGPRPTQVQGEHFETMSSGTIHDYGDVQGITVVSQSKTTMDQTVDQKQAQAELQKLTTAKTVYGVDIESTLARSRVKAIHEKEISSGTVRIGHAGVETTENVVKSVTEIKTARVGSATSKDTIEIDEKVLSSTTSSDQHTFKFSEITDTQATRSLTDIRRRNDIMNRTNTHKSIDYTDAYKNQLDKKEVLKTGQVLVEELYDTKTSFESMDKDRVKTRAIQDENLRTTTILEKSEDTNKPEPKPEPESYGPITRVTPIRQPSNLALEGTVDYTSTNRTDFIQKTTDRVKAVRRNTYTKQEGDMYLQTTTQSQFTPQVGDRYDAKKPVDQITTPEGTFSKRPQDKVVPKGERAEIHRTPDNLRPEGEFYGKPKEEAPKMGDRAPIKRPVDNLTSSGDKFYERPKEEAPKRGERAPVKKPVDQFPVPEGSFYVRPEQPAPLKGDRADIKRPVDNLTNSDAKFYVRPTETHGPVERREPIRQKDNLKPEGTFHSPTKEAAPTIGERAPKKIPKDQISIPEGTFSKRPQDTVFPRGERAEKVYHKDTTFFEGKFEETTTSQHDFRQVVGERADVRRAPDNLKPEGQFYGKPKEDAPTGEKRKPIKQQDNLYPEGQFYSPTKEAAPLKGDRADIKKPVDQIGISKADFTKRPEDVALTGEKRRPIKQHDNLYPEGQFYSPEKQPAPLKGDRADVKRPVDQIGISKADFTKRPEDAAPTGEKRKPIKQQDNLYPEGQFYSPEKAPAPTRGDRADIKKPVDQIGMSTADFTKRPEDVFPTGEKRQPIKQHDNLYPEGQFYSPDKTPAPTRGERADVKKPVDQIGLSNADFTKRPEDVFPTGEKRQPIKQHDNLYPEGQFYSPAKEPAPLKGDRADIKKPVDQIGIPKGDFTKRPEYDAPTGEKRRPIKQHDNLYPEGQFYSPEKPTAPLKGDRADIKKPVDQIGMSTADFTRRPEDAFPTGEKRQPIKQHDNLYPEGQFYSPEKPTAPLRGDRADIKKPVDQIGMSTADFTRRPEDVFPTGEKRKPIKQHDNLYPEGQFYSPTREPAPLKGDRADIKKPVDQIGMSTADFTRRPDVVPTGEKRQPIKQQDNLHPEGQFYTRPKEQAPLKGDRADIKKPVDQIGMSTADFTKRPEDVIPTGEKRKPIKQQDNLYPEGQFYSPEKAPAPTRGERADVKKPVDQIGLSPAEFTKRPEDVFPTGEKRKPIKQNDNLYPEGQFYSPEKQPAPLTGDRAEVKKPVDQIGMSTADFTRRPEDVVPNGEKRRPIKQQDNLHPEGQFYSPEKTPAPTRGERADIKKPVDQIGMSTADFTKRPEDVFPTGEKRQPIKQHDNLYPEGQFYSPTKEPAHTRGERADVKRPVDQIGMSTADFTKRSEDVAPTGEKRRPIKQHDNLYPEGQFYSPEKAPAPTRGDRADVKKPVDQIGLSPAEFTRRPEEAFPTGEKRQPIKQNDNLYPEGQFYAPDKEPAPLKGDRADIKKPVDQIGMSTADFTRRDTETVVMRGERAEKVYHKDATFFEGKFDETTTSQRDFRQVVGERAEVHRAPDNLRPEGQFYVRPKEDAPTGEKRKPIKQQDNLYPEGQFYSPEKQPAPLKGERADIKKPVDQIGKSTAEFTRRPEDVVPTGEKRKPIKQHDNLYPEGQFYSPEKYPAPLKGDRADTKKPVDQIGISKADFTKRPEDVAPTGEKRRPIKQQDNLYPEGQFYSPDKQSAPLKGDRADVKKPVDQIGISKADFTRRPEEVAPAGEKRKPIKQQDNLHPEGQFYSPEKHPAPIKGDRAEVKKPVDQIGKSTAEFARRPEDVVPTAERRQPIRKPDTLHPEGKFYTPEKQPAPGPGERADVVKPKDQFLMPDGDFSQRPEQAFPHGERRSPIRQKDNLRPEGQMYSPTKEPAPKFGERATIKKPVDNLKPVDAKFYERPKETPVNGERRTPLKQVDNLHVEGEFYDRHRETEYVRGERADTVIHEDTLRMQGKFHDATTSRDDYQQYTGERADIVRHKDHLVTEGRFTGTSRTHEEHRQFTGQRAETVRHEDNLRTTGDFYQRPVEEVPKGERRQPIRHKDNLFPEGQHYTPEKAPAPGPGDRANIKKPVDNLKTPEGKFSERPKENVPVTERRTQIRHEDSLKVEGEFYKRPKSPTVLKGERAPVKRPQDNLKLEGRMEVLDKTQVVRKGERAEVIRHKDNLTVGEGSMELESITRSQQRESLRSRTHTSTINQQKSHQQHSRDVVRKQTSSSIILGDEASDARFERTTTGKRNTVETRNLPNGHMLQEKSIESSVRHTAETRATEDRSVEQKLLSQSMSAKSTVNQSIVLNDVNETKRQATIESNNLASSTQTGSVNQVSTTSASRQSSQTRTQQQLQANKTGTREVQVTREVTVTKRQGDSGPGPRALPGTSVTTQNTSSSSTVMDQSSAHHMSQQEMNSSQRHHHVQESQGGYSLTRTGGRGITNGEPSGSTGTNKSTSHNQTHVLSNIQEGRVSSSTTQESQSSSSMRQNGAVSSHSQINQTNLISSPAGSPRNAASAVDRSSPQPQSLPNIQEGCATSSSSIRESQNLTSSSVNRNTSASTHSRIIHGTSGGQGNSGDWSTRDNAAGSDSFATSLRSGGIQTSSHLSGAGNTLVVRHADIVDTRRVGGSAHSGTSGHCAVHSPQSRSAAGVRTSTHNQAITSIGYSNNQQIRDNSYNNNVSTNGSRGQRTVRNDNLSPSNQKFEGQTSSNYGHFQMTERVVPVRSTQQSSISLGSYGTSANSATSSYKKEFTQRKVEPCPAALLESGKSPFKYERQSSSHRFYMPNVSD